MKEHGRRGKRRHRAGEIRADYMSAAHVGSSIRAAGEVIRVACAPTRASRASSAPARATDKPATSVFLLFFSFFVLCRVRRSGSPGAGRGASNCFSVRCGYETVRHCAFYSDTFRPSAARGIMISRAKYRLLLPRGGSSRDRPMLSAGDFSIFRSRCRGTDLSLVHDADYVDAVANGTLSAAGG